MSFDLKTDYFSVFSMPVSFPIDTGILMQRYHEIQQSVHPDRFASSSDQEKRLAMQYATHVNEALRVLKNPLERARYFLELKGVQWDDEQTTIADPEFLMQQMELRESLAEVRQQADPIDAVGEILDNVDTLFRDYLKELTRLLASESSEDLHRAKDQVRKMQFLEKLKHEAENLEAELEDI